MDQLPRRALFEVPRASPGRAASLFEMPRFSPRQQPPPTSVVEAPAEPPRVPALPAVDDPKIYISAAKLLEDNGHDLLAGALYADAERQFPNHAVLLLRHSYYIARTLGGDAAKADGS